jgi:hypothetical protein
MPTEVAWERLVLLLRLLLDGRAAADTNPDREAASLVRLGWARCEGRLLVAVDTAELATRLERVSPGILAVAQQVRELGLDPFDPAGYRLAARAAQVMPPLPVALSRKVASAILTPHSKHPLSEGAAAKVGIARLLPDGLFRARTATPLEFVAANGMSVDVARLTAGLGEAALPDRFLDRCERMIGILSAVVFVENSGAFTELPLPAGFLALHPPGSDVGAARVLRLLPGVPIIYFGDWDQRGREAAARVQREARLAGSPFRWLCPLWLADYFTRYAMAVKKTPWKRPFDDLPDPVQWLANRAMWIEQEAVVLDERLLVDLADNAS